MKLGRARRPVLALKVASLLDFDHEVGRLAFLERDGEVGILVEQVRAVVQGFGQVFPVPFLSKLRYLLPVRELLVRVCCYLVTSTISIERHQRHLVCSYPIALLHRVKLRS